MASTDVVDPELNQAVQDRNAALGSGNFLREVLAPFLQLPEVVFHAAAPEGEQTVRAAVGKPWKAAQVSSNDVPLLPYTPFMQSDVVTLVLSPFPNRRATLKLEPYDRPWDGDKFTKDATAYVRPSPLPSSPLIPRLCPFHVSREKQVQREADGAYGKLTYILREDVKAFTNLTCTLARAGFSSMDGKKALMETGWSLKWIKRLLPSDCSKLRFNAFQKINRFPGSWRVDKKDSLQRQMQLAERRWKYGQQNGQVKQDFGAHLYPEGWVLPEEAEACEVALRSASNQGVLFIAKPTESSCGRGIFLLQGGPDAQLPDLSVPVVGTPSATPPMKYVIQRYIANPYLVHGYKFDLRLYVVITSYEPFRMYLYHEGLVRFATTPYRALTADGKEGAVADAQFLTAHLTNFTLNKKTEDFHAPTPESTNTGAKSSELNPMWASKWSLSALREHMTREGVYSWNDTIDAVQDLLAKVFLSIAPEIRADMRKAEAAMNRLKQPNSPVDEDASKSTSPPYTHRGISPFFEVYGVDVLLRQSTTATGQRCLSPVIMEVNNAPALSTHYAPLDQCIKGNLLADVFNLVGLTSMAFKVSGGATQAPPGGFRQLFVDAGSSEADIREGAFLDQLCIADPTHVKVEACLTASEEQRRSPSFLCVIPSPTSASVYSPLFSRMPEEETADGLASITCDESLDSVLSSWAKSRNTTT